jgi:hypothetical protein
MDVVEYDNQTMFNLRRAVLFEIAYFSWRQYTKANTSRAAFAEQLVDALRYEPHNAVDHRMRRFAAKSGVCSLIKNQKRRPSAFIGSMDNIRLSSPIGGKVWESRNYRSSPT